MAFDPYSLAVSGAAGGVGGYLANENNQDRMRAYLKQLGLADDQIEQMANSRIGEVNSTYSPLTEGYAGNFQDLIGKLQNADFSQYDVQAPQGFEYDQVAETQKYFNPMIQDILDRATGQLESSAANKGDLFSGATGKAIVRSTSDLRAQDYNNASGIAERVGQNKYQQYQDNFNNLMTANTNNRSNMMQGLSSQQGAVNMQGGQFNTQQDLLNQIRQGLDASKVQNIGNRATTNANLAGSPNGFSAFLQGISGGLGA